MRHRVGRSLGVTLATVSLVSGGLLLGASPPAAADTLTFNCTGAAQTWTVPAGVTKRHVRRVGRARWSRPRDASSRRLGSNATATVAVTPAR